MLKVFVHPAWSAAPEISHTGGVLMCEEAVSTWQGWGAPNAFPPAPEDPVASLPHAGIHSQHTLSVTFVFIYL